MNRYLLSCILLFTSIVVSLSAQAGQAPTHVFVPDADGDISAAAGAAIASDVSVTLSQKGIEALTLANLKAQLKEQQYKELVGCDTKKGCIEERIDSFGFADRLFFHVIKLGEGKYHLEVSHFVKGELRRAGKLAHKVACSEDELGTYASLLALEVLGLSKPGSKKNSQEKWTPDGASPWAEP